MKNSCASRELSVGELARRAGVAVSALHFYETKGLISSQRNAGNQRRFSRETLRRVGGDQGRPAGRHSPRGDRSRPADPAGRAQPSAADWARLSAQWKEDLTERIDKLLLLRDQLDGCIGCGCLSLQACPLRNPGDQLSAEGPGAHWLDAEGREHDG
ncbi:redox-sensitive transcriptional activator SoxR [Pseudomonas aeruginosa]|nr:redox-sensitive transcriptional activator SoxR [Pseudomonas aeruginosa]